MLQPITIDLKEKLYDNAWNLQALEIGVKSDWISLGGETLGNGLIMEHFNKSGT